MSENTPDISVARIFEYEVIDPKLRGVGEVLGVWVDPASGELEFAGVKTQVVDPTLHLVPVHAAEIDDTTRSLRIPYERDQVHAAPSFGIHAQLTAGDRAAIHQHYGEGA